MFGSCWNWLFPPPTVMECIQSLKNVESSLQALYNKYDADILEKRSELKAKMRRKDSKSSCMASLRFIKLLESHRDGFQRRLEACVSKRLQLESLQVTALHVDAVKQTTRTFKKFLKENDISKIEKLQDSVQDMIEQAMEINETLGEESPLLVDMDDVEAEYQAMLMDTIPNIPATHVEVPINVPPVATSTSTSQPIPNIEPANTRRKVSTAV